MTSVNFLKPNKDNLNLFLVVGALFFSLGIIDFCLNNFYDKNITGFLPGFISFFTPLIFGMIGLHFCLLYTSPSPRDKRQSRMPSSA